jgi:hypothetical protein
MAKKKARPKPKKSAKKAKKTVRAKKHSARHKPARRKAPRRGGSKAPGVAVVEAFAVESSTVDVEEPEVAAEEEDFPPEIGGSE